MRLELQAGTSAQLPRPRAPTPRDSLAWLVLSEVDGKGATTGAVGWRDVVIPIQCLKAAPTLAASAQLHPSPCPSCSSHRQPVHLGYPPPGLAPRLESGLPRTLYRT